MAEGVGDVKIWLRRPARIATILPKPLALAAFGTGAAGTMRSAQVSPATREDEAG